MKSLLNQSIVFPRQLDFAEENSTDGIPTEIQVLPKGKWQHPAYGEIKLDTAALEEFKKNFDAGVRRQIPITEGHEVWEEKPAIGWMVACEVRNNGLWVTVEWTPTGKTRLAEKAFKYFSPEFYQIYQDPETQEEYQHVLVGGALTNKPYFKKLKAVVLSEHVIKLSDNSTMNLEDIRAKSAEELTDEEKDFLRQSQELTDEDKTKFASVLDNDGESTEEGEGDGAGEGEGAGDGAGTEEGGDSAGTEGDGEGTQEDGEGAGGSDEKVEITASELAALRGDAAAGREARQKLVASEIAESVSKMTFSETNKKGPFLVKTSEKVKSFMLTLSEKQRKDFASIMNEVPAANLFGEQGAGFQPEGATDFQTRLEKAVEVKMSENKVSYADALALVFQENAELAKEYKEAYSL